MNTANNFERFSEIPSRKKISLLLNKKPLKIFIPKYFRRKIAVNADLKHQAFLAECWLTVIERQLKGDLEYIQVFRKKDLHDEKFIWQYWGQGIDENLPDIVKICFNSVDKYKNDYTVIRLNDDNIQEYLEIPSFVSLKRKNPEFKHVFFSDLIRLALLNAYGGIWIDATVLLTAPIDKKIIDQDLFMFRRNEKAYEKYLWKKHNINYFNWHKSHYINTLSSFIVAKKGNKTISIILNLILNFWKHQDSIAHYFFLQIMIDVLIRNYPENKINLAIDDTLPHLLIKKIDRPFIKTEFDKILKKTHIHKMTYIKPQKNNTYYDYLSLNYQKPDEVQTKY